MPEPWNAPGCGRVLLKSLGRSDSPLLLRFSALPGLLGWGATFLKHSRPARYRQNTLSNLRLALFSLSVLDSLREQTRIEYGASSRGTLKLLRSTEALDLALAASDHLAGEGLSYRRLSREEAVELEPALAPIADQLQGAIHYPRDETGDAYRFCSALTEHAREHGVRFVFRTTVLGLDLHSRRIGAALTDKERFIADHYVVAAGSFSTMLLRRVGLRLPVRPAKGYSVSFAAPGGSVLKVPLVDDEMHAALVPIGDAIRAAGTAEFCGYDLALRPERVRNLVRLAQKLLPRAALDPAAARPWCGLRPMSADGVPIIGRTALENLWVNTGHGHLGWTMAAGSGLLLADLLEGTTPGIEPARYDLKRFAAVT
jgi:D-amino-acid dehydrogenase